MDRVEIGQELARCDARGLFLSVAQLVSIEFDDVQLYLSRFKIYLFVWLREREGV